MFDKKFCSFCLTHKSHQSNACQTLSTAYCVLCTDNCFLQYRNRAGGAAATGAGAAANAPSMDLDLPVDPNEPTYCFCNQVSYGEMVACDNPDCKIEWFHFGCVGLKEQPKGKWHCSDCSGMQKRKGK